MSNQEQQVDYKFAILSEDVATVDLFEDKTHERVSENLFQIIQYSSKGVTIGLEGSWGSGKSTVIKLLRDKLVKNGEEKNLFFMFDAWAHDGDPLRRIFLESLIRAIDPKEQNKSLKAIKERITGRTKTVEVKAKKSTSRLGKFLSLSALLIPLGSAFLGKVNYDNLFSPLNPQAHTPYYLFLCGLLFCLSPLIVLGYWWRWGDKDTNTKKVSWEFFSIDSKEDYIQDITEDGERTSIEFEDHFQCIIETAVKEGLIDRSIVVIDNLDRVDPEHAKNIWSTLQTFFQKRSNGSVNQNWSDKLWFVIPFDRDGFKKIWDANGANNEAAASFLKKCFQLIAEVPQPVMSAWSEYAKKSIEESLNQWPEIERSGVYSTYVRYLSKLDMSPTPRDIKAFVNQVGLLGAMWGGQVSVEAMCLYVLFKDSVSTNELRKSLIAGNLPNDYQSDSDRSTIYAEIAGLLFGVSRSKGLQLLLGPEINEAFKTGNGETLSKLVKDHGDAFWIAYEASKKTWMVGYTHTDEYKIDFTKAFHSGLIEHKKRLGRDIETLARVWIDTFNKFDFSKFDCAKSTNFVLELSHDPSDFLNSIHKFTSAELNKIILLVGKEDFPKDRLENFSHLTSLLKVRNKPLSALIYPTLNAKNWQTWLDYLAEYDLTFETVFPKKGVITEIATEVQFSYDNPNNTAVGNLVKTYGIYPKSPEWSAVADQMIAWMKLSNRVSNIEPMYELMMKFLTGEDKKISTKISACVSGAEFWVAAQSYSVNDNPTLPILAALSLQHELQKKDYVAPGIKLFWSSTGDQASAGKTYDYLKEINRLDVLWQLCRDEKNALAIQIVRDTDDDVLYSSWAGACFIDEFKWAEGNEVELIAKKLASNDAFFKNENGMKGEPTTYQSVYKIFYALNVPKICAFIDTEINQVDKETWRECIENNDDLLDLVGDKNHHFTDAFVDYLVDLMQGKVKIGAHSKLEQRIPSLLKKTADLDKTVIPKVMSAYMVENKDNLSASVFDVIAPFFVSHVGNVDEKSLMRRINSWIDEDALEKIEWLIKQNLKPFDEPLESLISRVKLGLKSDNSMTLKIAQLVNNSFNLGIKIEELPNEEVDEVETVDADEK